MNNTITIVLPPTIDKHTTHGPTTDGHTINGHTSNGSDPQEATDEPTDADTQNITTLESAEVQPSPSSHAVNAATNLGHVEPGTAEEQAAPLFSHEMPTSEAAQEGIGTTAPSRHASTQDMATITEDQEEAISHSSDLNELHSDHTSENFDELDQAPLLPHEMMRVENADAMEDGDASTASDVSGKHLEASTLESERAPTFPHERLHDDELLEAPLLPHERSSFSLSDGESEFSANRPISEDGQQVFDYELPPSSQSFFPRGSPLFHGAKSSHLPNSLPRTDAEDDNLHDPSLEEFPTDRKQILERVATMGMHLSEDVSHLSPILSPAVSSEACSSIDLVPIRSCTSLQAVVEESSGESGETSELPSPLIDTTATNAAATEEAASSDVEDQHLESTKHDTNVERIREDSSSESSIQKNDGAHDYGHLFQPQTPPLKQLSPFTPPITPKKPEITVTEAEATAKIPTTHSYVRPQTTESMKITPGPPHAYEQAAVEPLDPKWLNLTPTPDLSDRKDQKETILQSLFRVIFGWIPRLLTKMFSGGTVPRFR